MKTIVIRTLWAIACILAMLSLTHAQQQQPVAMDSYIESMRADLRADKVAILAQGMNFSPEEAKVFWPVYRRYEVQMMALNDDRVALMRTFVEMGPETSEADARQLTTRVIDFEAKRAALHRKYVSELQKTSLSALTIVRVVQLEHRFDLFVEMNVTSTLPPLILQTAGVRQ